ncbi:MAG: MoxR family ATPase [Oscillospiraceae bacterium]|nr:MoxR family ATPase [Oscillospiraceae bacterium]
MRDNIKGNYVAEEQNRKIKQIIDEVEKVIIGKRDVVKMLVIALLSGGHVLIEDVPGVGKTTLATAISKSTGLQCRRSQFTPDVMASDITGFTIYNKDTNDFEYRPGMVMCNLLLADEINRTSPKTQSALLEAMEEQNVTVDGITYQLPQPFMVIATQNELGFVGTYPLPEAQLDRFLMKISVGYPTLEQEVNIIASRQTADPLEAVNAVCTKKELISCIESVQYVNIEQSVYRYIVQLVSSTRNHKSILLGASPRSSLLLMRASQACAFLSGRAYVTPEDVLRMTPHVLEHRLQLTQDAKVRKMTPLNVLREIAKSIIPPYHRD